MGAYDYLEANGVENIADVLGGTATTIMPAGVTERLRCLELPYFYSPRIDDLSESEMTRREVALIRLNKSEASYRELRDHRKKRTVFSPDNVFVSAVVDFTKPEYSGGRERPSKP